MDKKYWIVLGIVVAAVFVAQFLLLPTDSQDEDQATEKPIVSVSTFTLYEVSRAVAAETLDVRPIIPPGTDAHMFSPNPKQVADISRSALFIFNGAGFESWADALTQTLSEKTRIIDMSRNVKLISQDDHNECHDNHHEHEHTHGSYDPHYWLDIDNMIAITRAVESEFSKQFPQNSALYYQNAQRYIAELEVLKADYKQGLLECRNRFLVSNHGAFGYLAHANGLKPVSVIGLSSDEQPSAKNIADIIAMVKTHGVKTIFFEEFISDQIAQTIARETGASAQSLQPLENISENELRSAQTYLSIMRGNLAKLKDAMECR